jgi:hypothetical protein
MAQLVQLQILAQISASLTGQAPVQNPVSAAAPVTPTPAVETQEQRYAIIAQVRQDMGLVDNDHENQRLAGMDNFSEGRVRAALKTIEHEKAAAAAAARPAPTPTTTPAPAPTPPVDRVAVVEDLRKEILGGRQITDEFRARLQALPGPDEARAMLLQYRNTGEAIAQMDRARGVSPYWQDINRLANNVVMGRMTLDQAKAERQASAPTAPAPAPAPTPVPPTPSPAPGGATAATSVAAAGLLAGMTGKGVK